MHKAINSFCRQLNVEVKLSRWSGEPAIHREFVPVSQMLFLFPNRTGIYDWATNLHRLETDLKRLKQLSVCRHKQERALGFCPSRLFQQGYKNLSSGEPCLARWLSQSPKSRQHCHAREPHLLLAIPKTEPL